MHARRFRNRSQKHSTLLLGAVTFGLATSCATCPPASPGSPTTTGQTSSQTSSDDAAHSDTQPRAEVARCIEPQSATLPDHISVIAEINACPTRRIDGRVCISTVHGVPVLQQIDQSGRTEVIDGAAQGPHVYYPATTDTGELSYVRADGASAELVTRGANREVLRLAAWPRVSLVPRYVSFADSSGFRVLTLAADDDGNIELLDSSGHRTIPVPGTGRIRAALHGETFVIARQELPNAENPTSTVQVRTPAGVQHATHSGRVVAISSLLTHVALVSLRLGAAPQSDVFVAEPTDPSSARRIPIDGYSYALSPCGQRLFVASRVERTEGGATHTVGSVNLHNMAYTELFQSTCLVELSVHHGLLAAACHDGAYLSSVTLITSDGEQQRTFPTRDGNQIEFVVPALRL